MSERSDSIALRRFARLANQFEKAAKAYPAFGIAIVNEGTWQVIPKPALPGLENGVLVAHPVPQEFRRLSMLAGQQVQLLGPEYTQRIAGEILADPDPILRWALVVVTLTRGPIDHGNLNQAGIATDPELHAEIAHFFDESITAMEQLMGVDRQQLGCAFHPTHTARAESDPPEAHNETGGPAILIVEKSLMARFQWNQTEFKIGEGQLNLLRLLHEGRGRVVPRREIVAKLTIRDARIYDELSRLRKTLREFAGKDIPSGGGDFDVATWIKKLVECVSGRGYKLGVSPDQLSLPPPTCTV